MAGFSAQIRSDQVREVLAARARRIEDATPALKAMGTHMLRSIQLNFDAGGRPRRWQPSKRALREGGQTLRDKGHLASSMTMRVDPTSVRLGTNNPYARIHQLGGEIRHRRRAPRRVGRFRTIRTGAIIRMPARPFVLVQAGDRPILREILRDWLREGTA